MNEKILEYVDDVLSMIPAPQEFKSRLENDLTNHISESSKNVGVDNALKKLGDPETLANKISRELYGNNSDIFGRVVSKDMKLKNVSGKSCSEFMPSGNHSKCMPRRYWGEYERQETDIDIKLLYIPLIQINIGMEKIRMPITEYDYD